MHCHYVSILSCGPNVGAMRVRYAMEAVSHLELSGIFYHCSSSATAVSQAAVTVRTLPAEEDKGLVNPEANTTPDLVAKQCEEHVCHKSNQRGCRHHGHC